MIMRNWFDWVRHGRMGTPVQKIRIYTAYESVIEKEVKDGPKRAKRVISKRRKSGPRKPRGRSK